MAIHKGKHATILSSLDALLRLTVNAPRGKGTGAPEAGKDPAAGVETSPTESSTPNSSWLSGDFCAKIQSATVQM